MSDFWPHELDLSDKRSPMEILESAQADWETNSEGLLTLVLQTAESESGNTMIVVHTKHTPDNRTTTLFSVVHRASTPYPVTIQPENEDLPNFLKRSYYDPGLSVTIPGISGREVENEWVSDTPAEFCKKLQRAFNLGSVKREVLGLVTHSPATEDELPNDGDGSMNEG